MLWPKELWENWLIVTDPLHKKSKSQKVIGQDAACFYTHMCEYVNGKLSRGKNVMEKGP